MAKNIRGKRPCIICRKWFQPIPQQKERQKTCSRACRHEHHRRQCEKWNRKNKEYSKNNHLGSKIDAIDQQEQSKDPPPDQEEQSTNSPDLVLPQSNPAEPILPMDVLTAQFGKKHAVIIQYLVFQVTRHVRIRTSGFT